TRAVCGGDYDVGYWANDSVEGFVKRRVGGELYFDSDSVDKLLNRTGKAKVLLPASFSGNQMYIPDLLERGDVKMIYLIQHNKTKQKELTAMAERLLEYKDKVLGCVMCNVPRFGLFSYYKLMNPYY
ncbi:MAG: hypothetical protein LBN43_05285, partial [Oscillospiraceae bacterium]|nr:hypothetical protein [Oscillospiraceae bacterium]